MEQAFLDLYRKEGRGNGRIARLWTRTLSDLAATAFAERIRPHANDEEVVMQDRRLAVIGFVLVLAPLYFVSASLLKYGLGIGFLFDPLEAFLTVAGRRAVFNLVSPVVFLGGLCLALALNAYAVTRFDFSSEEGSVVSTVRLKLGLWNIAVAVVSILLLLTLVGYAFLENFPYRP
ncbi:MAG: hypothetical protein H0U55_04965 [Rubrobacteraceae bacterium]|nr:hypothetical protein [Rubrobacteraceae bacterium]